MVTRADTYTGRTEAVNHTIMKQSNMISSMSTKHETLDDWRLSGERCIDYSLV